MQPAVVIVFIVVVVALLVIGMAAAAKRRKEMGAWAASRGLRFSSSRDSSMDGRFAEFRCLRRGHSRYAHNVMRGDWNGRPLVAFDYHYVTGSGKNRTTHRFSAVVLASPVPLRPLVIRPEGLFDKFAGFFGYDDIDFESAEFSRQFFVKSPDRKWAYDVIHAQTIEYLMAMPRFTLQFDTECVIAYRSSRLKPAEFGSAVALIEGVLDRLPDYLVRQQHGEA